MITKGRLIMKTNIICKIFGHRFTYFLQSASPLRDYRVCRTCSRLQEHKYIPHKWSWVYLVERTKEGATVYFADKEKSHTRFIIKRLKKIGRAGQI